MAPTTEMARAAAPDKAGTKGEASPSLFPFVGGVVVGMTVTEIVVVRVVVVGVTARRRGVTRGRGARRRAVCGR